MKKDSISRNFSRYAAQYEERARLQMLVAQELVHQFGAAQGAVLDIGAGPGIIAKNSTLDVIALDLSYDMCALNKIAINADAENLPFVDAAFANVICNLSLQWVNDLEKALAEIHRVLQKGGKFGFTTFAPDSLKNLKAAFTYLDAEQHLMEFEHAIKIFAMLKKSGFENIVMTSQKMIFYFPDMLTALRSIKNIGAAYSFNRANGLKTKNYFSKLENIYRGITKLQDKIPLEWEVLYIHAEKAA